MHDIVAARIIAYAWTPIASLVNVCSISGDKVNDSRVDGSRVDIVI